MLRFNDNSGCDGEELKFFFGFSFNVNLLLVLERIIFCFRGWVFNLENGDNKIVKSYIKKIWGFRDRKGGFSEFYKYFFIWKYFVNMILFRVFYRGGKVILEFCFIFIKLGGVIY